jgi:3'-phosphoadenosine 5'-phosphosulfate (PAPS) 3'-phosphatase
MVSVEDLEVLAAIAVDASAVIMSIRDQGFTSSRKADNSIVTQADEAAEALIHQRLGAFGPPRR